MRLLEKLSFSLNLFLHLENENVELSSCWSSPNPRQWGTDALGVCDWAGVMKPGPTPESLRSCSSESHTQLCCLSLYIFKFFFFLITISFLQQSYFPSPEIQLYWIFSLWFFCLYLLRLKIQGNLLWRPPGFIDHLPNKFAKHWFSFLEVCCIWWPPALWVCEQLTKCTRWQRQDFFSRNITTPPPQW